MSDETYDGPVCYQDGWHHSVVDDEHGGQMPDRKLYLDEETGTYRFATDGDQSWHDRHHQRLTVVAVGGGLGEPRTPEEFEACHRHLDELEERIKAEALDPHERDHFLTTLEEVRVVRGWLNRGGTR